MKGDLNCTLGAVSPADAAHVLLHGRAKDPVAADLHALALDAEVARVVVRARRPVQDVLRGRVVRLLDPVEAGQLALVLCVPDQQ